MDVSDLTNNASANGSVVATVRITLEAASVIWTLCAFNFVFGLVCNSLVISTILRTKSLCNSSINRAVLSLCLADLLTVIVEVPLMAVTLVGNYNQFMPWSNTGFCCVQSFSHSLAQSVQVMCFPVIAVERLYSISHPFEKEKHLKRVTYLNITCWITGVLIAGLTAFSYPITNVSIYCNDTPLRPADVKPLYRRTIYLTIPIGFASLLFTVICYGLIVYRVRRKWQKSAANIGALGQYQGSKKRHSSPFLATDAFVAASAILSQATLVDPTMSEEDEARSHSGRPSSIKIKKRERRRASMAFGDSFSRTKSVEFDDGRKRTAPPILPIPNGCRAPRPILRKSNAVCIEDDEDDLDGFDVSDIPMRSVSNCSQRVKKTSLGINSHLTIPTVVKARRAISLGSPDSPFSSAESSRTPSTVNSFDYDDTSIFTVQSSFDDDRTNTSNETPPSTAAAALGNSPSPERPYMEARMRELVAPIIAVTMVDFEDGDSGGGGDGATRRSSRDSRKTSVYGPPGSMLEPPPGLAPPRRERSMSSALSVLLQRTSSISSQLSTLSSPLTSSDGGEFRIYGRHRRSMPTWSTPGSRNNSRKIAGPFCVRDKRAREMGKRRSEAKTAKRSSYIVLAFLAMWLPLPVVVAVGTYFINVDEEGMEGLGLQWHLDLQLGVFCFSLLTAATNPIIYGLAIRSFRIAFNKLCRNDWNRMKNRWTCNSL